MASLSMPWWTVDIGDYQLSRVHRFEVISSRLALVDTASIEIPVGLIPEPTAGTEAVVQQGYRGTGHWELLAGTVRRVERRGDNLVVSAWDPMGPLLRRQVSRAFTGATPQEVLRWVLTEAGVTQFRLTGRRYPSKPRFVASGTVGQVVASIGLAWGIHNDCYWLPDVGVWWGPPEESERASHTAAVIRYGENLLDHVVEPGAKRGRLVTPAAPIVHSNMVDVEDPRAWDGRRRLRVDRSVHRVRPAEVVIEWSDPAAN